MSIIVGNNGSGKSNVLEAISGIFANAYAKKPLHKFIYKLEYRIDDNDIRLERTEHRCQYYRNNKVISIDDLIKERLLPTNVIALYSGEDLRWWQNYYEPFHKKYLSYVNNLISIVPQNRMYYINRDYWDIALLTLIFSNAEDDKEFLKQTIGVNEIEHILIFLKHLYTINTKSERLKAFFRSLKEFSKHSETDDGEPVSMFALTADDIKTQYGVLINKRIASLSELFLFFDAVFLAGEHEDFNCFEKEFFDFFVQAYIPKKKEIVNNIEIICDGYSAKQLSEGEKKLILLRAVLSFVADENSLLLFDEPDANIHEGRKQDTYNLFKEYVQYDRQMVVTTHSPIIAQLSNDNELIMLDNNNGKVSIYSDEKKEKIKALSGSSWDIIGQEMMFKSKKPLVIFEGKTDLLYVNEAIKRLSKTETKYSTINAEFINVNGSGNVKSFVENLRAFIPEDKKVVVFFDRDNGGKQGAQGVTGINQSDERIVHYQDINQGNTIATFIPYKEDVTHGDFLIEDYFPWEPTIKNMVYKMIPEKGNPYKSLPNIKEKMKKEIEKQYFDFDDNAFAGFKPLLDKIIDLTKE